MPVRPVDRAMRAERIEKRVVRGLWLESVTSWAEAYPEENTPLYLTLSGAEGRDIELLIESGLVETTETGAIAPTHQHRVVAVERNIAAVIALQKKFPGLKIFDHPFQSLVHGDSPLRWPEGAEEDYCLARVINLDLDETLHARVREDQLRFPVLDWIAKLAQIHARHQIDWSLCFTLHGEILWDADAWNSVQQFLTENFARDATFADHCRSWLGVSLFNAISNVAAELGRLTTFEQQRILMVFVPKKIAQLVSSQGWRVVTQRNLSYGGASAHAPMVTWIIDFAGESRVSRQPDAVYRECLREILTGAGAIEEDGSIS